ncbi:hypothetical protein HAX54_036846 [Datura stramonium]|uniref:Uncharacterized protein n=1 Tax=Datura stramonium TaxID=4076 RepID=A0ABS8SGS3_DATST|nr:hypothetical protein [Datura stramonium]
MAPNVECSRTTTKSARKNELHMRDENPGTPINFFIFNFTKDSSVVALKVLWSLQNHRLSLNVYFEESHPVNHHSTHAINHYQCMLVAIVFESKKLSEVIGEDKLQCGVTDGGRKMVLLISKHYKKEKVSLI